MLRLNLTTEPRWVDLIDGVRVHVLPVTSAIMLASRMDPAVLQQSDEDGAFAVGAAVAKAVARRVITDWEGVGDAAGKTVPVTPENVSAFLDVWPVFEAFQQKIMAPVLALESEKNVSAPLQRGTSRRSGAKATAKDAAKGAKGARTSPASRKRSKAGRSGI